MKVICDLGPQKGQSFKLRFIDHNISIDVWFMIGQYL